MTINETQIKCIKCTDKNYPQRLKEIPDKPDELHVIGNLPDDNVVTVGIIGARNCSAYGRIIATQLGEMMALYNIQVVSGMARGIDGISQRAALQKGGEVFAVLGSGVDVCYPKENNDIYDMAVKRGGIISPYPEGTPPLAWNFPPRNRIISGLSDVLVVIEAGMKSGTMITVDMALEQGKEVYVVPGRITDRLSEGCNYLISQGANVIVSVNEFVNELQGRCGTNNIENENKKKQWENSGLEGLVIDSLNDEPKSVGELWEDIKEKVCDYNTGLNISDLTKVLMEMQINGKVGKEGGKIFILFTNS